MASEVSNYKCPACTGPLRFDAASGKLVCDYCDSVYELSYIEELVKQAENDAAEAFDKRTKKKKDPKVPDMSAVGRSDEERTAEYSGPVFTDDGKEWDTSGLSSDWGGDDEDLTAYSCPSCGAGIICHKTTAATSCPYCGNNTIIPGQLAGVLRPDYIIPFKVSREDAEKTLKDYYEHKIFLPKKFKRGNRIREIKGMHVPYWFFSADASARITMQGNNTKVYRMGDNEITETDHFHVYREGNISFDRIPVDASKKMRDDYMDSLEPFDYSELCDFSTAYLPGFMADKYDVSADSCFERADERCRNSIIAQVEDTVQGYMEKVPIRRDVDVRRGAVRYGLMPVWMLITHWRDKDFLFLVNGQTRKTVGNLPFDPGRVIGVFAAIMLAASIFVWLIYMAITGSDYGGMSIVPFIGGAIISGIITFGLSFGMRNVNQAGSAGGYAVQGSFKITKSEDYFTHTTQTVRRLPKNKRK